MQYKIITAALAVFIILISYTDLRYRKIYNWMTVPYLILGIIVNTYLNGMNGLHTSLLGSIVGFFILLLPFLLGWIGGGDVKFLTAVGGWIGPKLILYSTLWGIIFCGIGALIYLITKGNFIKFIKQLSMLLFSLKNITKIEATGTLPLGVFLGVGILSNWIYFQFYL